MTVFLYLAPIFLKRIWPPSKSRSTARHGRLPALDCGSPAASAEGDAAAQGGCGHPERACPALVHAANEAAALCLGEEDGRGTAEEATLPPSFSLRRLLSGALNPHSALLHTSLRYGSMIAVAVAVAYSLDLNRSYWVPGRLLVACTGCSAAHRLRSDHGGRE